MDPSGEVSDNSKEAQEGEGGAGRRRGCIHRARGGQKLSTLYEGAAARNPSNYVVLSIVGKVRVDKNRGDGGSAGGGRGR